MVAVEDTVCTHKVPTAMCLYIRVTAIHFVCTVPFFSAWRRHVGWTEIVCVDYSRASEIESLVYGESTVATKGYMILLMHV